MTTVLIQISLISLIAWLYLIFNKSSAYGLRVKVVSFCLLISLLVPVIYMSPVTFNEINFVINADQPHEVVPNWVGRSEPASTFETKSVLIDNDTEILSNKLQSQTVSSDVFKLLVNCLVIIWLVGASYQIVKKMSLFFRLKKIVSNSKSVHDHNFDIAVKSSHETEIPFLYAFARKVVILPETMMQWPEQRIGHVITHEMCHLRRKDHWHLWLIHMIQVVYWFHPVLGYLCHRQQQEIELACDQLVLDQGVDGLSYSETLLACAAQQRQFNNVLSISPKPKQIKIRMQSVLKHNMSNSRKFVRRTLAFAVVMMVLVGCVDFKAVTTVPASTMIQLIGYDVPTLKDGLLDKNQVIISAWYDGAENGQTAVEVELKNKENQVSWLSLGPLKKFSEHIHTWNFLLKEGAFLTGSIKIKGVEEDGVIDGIAIGILSVDEKQNISVTQSKSDWAQGSTPNMVCAWPLGLSEPELLKLLPQLTVNSPDAVERIICGSQLLQNGEFQLNLL